MKWSLVVLFHLKKSARVDTRLVKVSYEGFTEGQWLIEFGQGFSLKATFWTPTDSRALVEIKSGEIWKCKQALVAKLLACSDGTWATQQDVMCHFYSDTCFLLSFSGVGRGSENTRDLEELFFLLLSDWQKRGAHQQSISNAFIFLSYFLFYGVSIISFFSSSFPFIVQIWADC